MKTQRKRFFDICKLRKKQNLAKLQKITRTNARWRVRAKIHENHASKTRSSARAQKNWCQELSQEPSNPKSISIVNFFREFVGLAHYMIVSRAKSPLNRSHLAFYFLTGVPVMPGRSLASSNPDFTDSSGTLMIVSREKSPLSLSRITFYVLASLLLMVSRLCRVSLDFQ